MSPIVGVSATLKWKNSQIHKLLLTRKRITHNISTNGVNRVSKTQSKLENFANVFVMYFAMFCTFLCTTSTSREFDYIWQSRRVGLIAKKIERTRIHFLSDVLTVVAVATYLRQPCSLRFYEHFSNFHRIFILKNRTNSIEVTVLGCPKFSVQKSDNLYIISEIQKKSQLNYWTDQLTIYLV